MILGADNAKDDGVYSAYFYDYFNNDGVYSMRAYGKGIGGQTHILREIRELQPDSSSSSYQGNLCVAL